MGKILIAQRRGKGGPAYVRPGHRFFGDISYWKQSQQEETGVVVGQVIGFVDDPARGALVVEIVLADGKKVYSIAAEGLLVGQQVEIGREARPVVGSTMPLEKIPDSTPVFNVEKEPGDGGKLARGSGSFATIVMHDEETGKVNIKLPSKQVISLKPSCRATVGVACGGGRSEKPFMKASAKRFAYEAKNRYYPIVRGRAKSAYAHPYGGKTGGRPTMVRRSTPPGRKAGHIAARRVGRRKK